MANVEFRVPYSQRYLINAIPDTNHNANPTNRNRNSKGNPNHTKPINPTSPNTMYRCEYGTLTVHFHTTWEYEGLGFGRVTLELRLRLG